MNSSPQVEEVAHSQSNCLPLYLKKILRYWLIHKQSKMHSVSKSRHSCIDYCSSALFPQAHVRKTGFKPNLLCLTAIIKEIVAIPSQYQSFYATSALYITCINHRPCLWLNKPFGVEYVWLKQALGLPSGLLALISHCLLFFLGGGSSQRVCVMTAATPYSHLTSDGEELTWTDGTMRDLQMTLMDYQSAFPWLCWSASLSLTHFTPEEKSDRRRRGSADTFRNSLSTTVVTLMKE